MKKTEMRSVCDLCEGVRFSADVRCDSHHVDLCPSHMRAHFDRNKCCLVPVDMEVASSVEVQNGTLKIATTPKNFLTISELADRWRIARPTVYDRLRDAGAKVLDFAPKNGRGRKVVAMGEVLRVENQRLRRL